MSVKELTIRQLARKTGVGSKALRYWESVRLLPRPRRNYNNYRIYDEGAVQRVQFIRKAKSLGFTLSEIRGIFELCRAHGAPCEEVVDWAGKKISALETQIEALVQLRKRLVLHHRKWKRQSGCPPMSPNEICCLIEEVPLSEMSHDPQRR